MKNGKQVTAVITHINQLPAGYIQLTKCIPHGAHRRATRLKWLSDAHNEGKISAYKLFRTVNDWKTGPVFVHAEEAAEYLRQYEAKLAHGTSSPREKEQPDDVLPVADEIRSLRAAVARLTEAIESCLERQAIQSAVADCDSPNTLWKPHDVELPG